MRSTRSSLPTSPGSSWARAASCSPDPEQIRGYSEGIDRRAFLSRLGTGAVAAAAGGVAYPETATPALDPGLTGFGRLFDLPAFAQASPSVERALLELGRRGGLLDLRDRVRDNPQVPAGATFFAQFLTHDVTFDATSKLGIGTPLANAFNARTSAFDLETVYLSGPVVNPELYDTTDPRKLRVESGGVHEDLPRAANGIALIGDPRNDQTAPLGALHAAFLLFHNRMVERVGTFEAAQRETRWHYQWLILHELLPQLVGRKLVDDVLRNGRRYYKPSGRAFVPLEFQSAAFRFGHSTIRPSYRMNASFAAPLFAPGADAKSDPDDLRGSVRSPRRYVDWNLFFDFPGLPRAQRSKRMGPHVASPLFDLPLMAIPTRDGTTALPQRDLLRHLTWRLPSGQAVARRMQVPALTPRDLRELAPLGSGLDRSTPLWYYLLKESAVAEDGLRLGPAAGRIVAEVVIGILQLDKRGYHRLQPTWKPAVGGASFRMTDFLAFAGVDPKSRLTSTSGRLN